MQWLLSNGKWVGSGDILIGLTMGAMLGSWELLGVALLIAYILGGLFAAVALVTHRKKRGDRIPFIPFLFIATMVTLLERWL